MKGTIIIVCLIALLSAIVVMPVAATTWDVSPEQSIQSAINGASSGDTIFVHEGTYVLPFYGDNHLHVGTPNITLKGEGAGKVTLDGNGSGIAIFIGVSSSPPYPCVPAPGCIIEGFTITNCSMGVAVGDQQAPNCIIRNNVIEVSKSPVNTFASNTTIKGNIFDGMSEYIQFAEGLEHLTFIDNVVSNSTKTYASTKVYAANSVIANNTFINNVAGLGLYNVPATNITVARNNLISSGAGIRLYNAPSGNKIYLNNIVDNTENVVIGGSGTPINFWNSTEPIEYVCPTDGNTYTDYLGNYWSDHPSGAEDGCGIWAAPYGIPPGSPVDYDYRPLMAGYENYLGAPAAEPPHLVTYTISNRTITPPQTSEIDVEFSEAVEAWISIEDSDRNLVKELYHSAAVTNPAPKTWDGTYENDTVVPAGDYYVNVTGTSTTTGLSVVNNTEVITVVITEPDLTPTAITTPANIYATESNSINATIKNNGTGDAGAFNVSLSAEGTVVDRTGVTGLGAGASTEVSLEWTPSESGTYELCVVADCDGVIDESDETNNVTCRSVYAVQPGNVVYFVPEDSGASYGNSVDIDLMADVDETNPVTATSVNFTFDPDCVEITNWAGNTSVWAGGTTSTILWSIPRGFIKITTAIGANPAATGSVPLGTLTLHCNCTEYCKTGLNFTTAEYTKEGGGTIYAAKEDGTFTCENAPDLVVSEKHEEWVNMVSKTYKVHYTVKNEGNANAGVSNVSLRVDGVEKETKQVPALSQGQTHSGTFDTTLTMSGENDTILVCADCNNEVFEFNEGNNCMENEWTSALKVDIGDYVVTPGSTVKAPITVYGTQNYGTGTISVSFDKTVAQVTKVESSSDSTVAGSTIDNSAGIVTISAWNVSGTSGDVIFAYVTFKAVGASGSSTALDLTVSSLKDISNMDIPTYTENGLLAIREDAPPVVADQTATPGTILNDNGRTRVPGTNVSELSVYVADTAGVASVTVNLTPICGPGNDSVLMTRTAGDDQSGTWSLNVTATYDAGVDKTHCLTVNATDVSGNSNTDKCILLTVLRRGDVNVGFAHDNEVDMGDALYIARYTVGKEPAPDTFVADVVGAGGAADCYNGVDMGDALYIARYTVGKEVAP